ncbi:hypothetical protein J6590_067422 [Homalodisca vitripennis]|nr:hypothetical protein J6590_067422 [Homalodisca vitripennis]
MDDAKTNRLTSAKYGRHRLTQTLLEHSTPTTEHWQGFPNLVSQPISTPLNHLQALAYERRTRKKTSASTGTPSRGNSKTRLTPSLTAASRLTRAYFLPRFSINKLELWYIFNIPSFTYGHVANSTFENERLCRNCGELS